jgi:hypothetical protein
VVNRPTLAVLAVAAIVTAVVVLVVEAGPAAAQSADAPDLDQVIDGIRRWLVGLLAGLATLFLTIGGLRYLTAGGDPGQVERAKSALRSAVVGYVMAALAPVFVRILQSIVGV